MSEIKWIKITTDIFDDEKICLIDALPDHDAILVIWFKILALAGKHNRNGLLMMSDKVHYTDEMLATIFRRPLNTVRMALGIFEQFGMIEIIDGIIALPNWEKHQNIDGMEKIKEQTRNRVARHREKQKNLALGSNVTCNVTVTESNATEEDRDKELDKDKNINNQNNSENQIKIIVEEYQSRISPLDGTQFSIIKEFVELDQMEPEVILKAIGLAADNGKRNFSYIRAILTNWKNDGILTVAAVDERERTFKENKNKGSINQSNKKSNVPEWSNPDYVNNTSDETKRELEKKKMEMLNRLEKGAK
ncbi:phage replisome organizer N-terminal domain-containing protein [Streptococcus sp. CL9.43]|uniref:phage replisome organizer N-terminal domain-containing protein n=1 Tax=Streptococcus sp. CL9.43 TaxID=3392238 RepID=UPI003C7D049F